MPLLTTQNFTPQDLLSQRNRDVVQRVAEAWDDVFGKDTRGGVNALNRQSVILDGLGTCFRHNDWSDDYGFFMTIRMHPLDMRREETQENARKLTRRFIATFPATRNRIEYEGHESFLQGGPVTVFVVTHNTAVGD